MMIPSANNGRNASAQPCVGKSQEDGVKLARDWVAGSFRYKQPCKYSGLEEMQLLSASLDTSNHAVHLLCPNVIYGDFKWRFPEIQFIFIGAPFTITCLIILNFRSLSIPRTKPVPWNSRVFPQKLAMGSEDACRLRLWVSGLHGFCTSLVSSKSCQVTPCFSQ